jgi:hypothetical protein
MQNQGYLLTWPCAACARPVAAASCTPPAAAHQIAIKTSNNLPLTWPCSPCDASLLLPLPVLSLLPLQVLLPLELLLPIGLPDELRLEAASFLLGVKAFTSLAVHLLR